LTAASWRPRSTTICCARFGAMAALEPSVGCRSVCAADFDPPVVACSMARPDGKRIFRSATGEALLEVGNKGKDLEISEGIIRMELAKSFNVSNRAATALSIFAVFASTVLAFLLAMTDSGGGNDGRTGDRVVNDAADNVLGTVLGDFAIVTDGRHTAAGPDVEAGRRCGSVAESTDTPVQGLSMRVPSRPTTRGQGRVQMLQRACPLA
jgi:hypothetical protein